ncbi:MAG: hypothetical protein K5945_03630 [Bacteroidaceae bacterium]|nr:hypothetical protein [Bacteroidaceae bacterium]
MTFRHLPLFLLGILFSPLICLAQDFDPQSDTWVCVDELGRNVATSDEGVSRTDIDETSVIGMFYYVWHGQHGAETKDNTRLVAANPENPAFGGWGSFHWGGKPALGYYTGGTPYIVARHMQMLVDAGIDFYFFDVTNAYTYDEQVKVVMKEIDRRTQLGLRSPKLAFLTRSSSVAVVTNLYNAFYANAANDKYWYKWEGKPLIFMEDNKETELPSHIQSYFTFRYSWAWSTGSKKWAWLAYYPQGTGTMNGKTEQISVGVAMHPTSRIGKSYHNGAQPAFDKYGLCKETPQGLFFQEQWKQAHKVHPPVVMITQWNEWMAQRFKIEDSSQFGLVRPGATAKIGETYFVDVYNQEFSRDIEPSSEPLIRDHYYLQMVSNIRQYRGVHKIPTPTVSRNIDIDGDFEQWADVTPEFRDEPGDVYYTSTTAQSSIERMRNSNDIVTAKVTKDAENLYFYVSTREEIRQLSTSNEKVRWMSLLLNADCDYSNGWYGYDYMVSNESQKMKLFRYSATEWEAIADVRWQAEGKEMMLTLDRRILGLEADTDFDFKWIDNIEKANNDVLYFLAKGEAAPNGRFNYRYKGSRLLTQKFHGYYYIENAYDAWNEKTTKALLDASAERLDWDTENEADLRFVWQITPEGDAYSFRNIATGRSIGPLSQPTLNGDGCGSPVAMSTTPALLHITMGENGKLLIHHGGQCTQHGRQCQSFHVNGHNTDKPKTAPAPDGVTAWLDDNSDLSTWTLRDATAVTYRSRLEALINTHTRDQYIAGTEFGQYLLTFVAAYQEAYDKAIELLDSEADAFSPALNDAISRLQETLATVESQGYIPLSDGYYYIASAFEWDDFTTKAFHAGTNYVNVADLIKGRVEFSAGRPICIFQITYNADEAHSYTIYSPSLNKYVGRWKTSQVPMVLEASKAPVRIVATGRGTVLMYFANETDEKSFYPVYYNKSSYTSTGKNYRIKGQPVQENALSEWRLLPTLPDEENPYVLNDTLCQLDTLLDSHPLRRYEGGAYDALLLANFVSARSEAQQADDARQGHYAAVLRTLQAAIDALEGRTAVETLRSKPSPALRNLYDISGRPATSQFGGVVVEQGKKRLRR